MARVIRYKCADMLHSNLFERQGRGMGLEEAKEELKGCLYFLSRGQRVTAFCRVL